VAIDTKTLSEAAGSAGALVQPKYGAGDKCPDCGSVMMRMPTGEVACPSCGYGSKKAVGFMVEAKDAGTFEVKEAANGTLIIEGYASTWGKDRDGDTIDRKAFDESLPAYLADNPVLLLDHDRTKVLGAVLKAWTDEIGLRIRGSVPRPETGEESWKLTAYNDIKRGLRRALSVAGVFIRGEKSARKHIERVDLYEISNIAVPSNPKALFQVVEEKGLTFWDEKTIEEAEKAQDTADNRRQWAKEGKALPDGSFPVLRCGSGPFTVGAAIRRMGSGNADESRIKAHIIRRAKTLGCVGQLPDDWNVGKSAPAPGDEPCEDCPDGEQKSDGGSGPVLQNRAIKSQEEAIDVAGENGTEGAVGTKAAPDDKANGDGGSNGAKTVTLSEDDYKSLKSGHESFMELKRKQEVEQTAEHIANQRIEAEQKAAAKAEADKKAFYEEVAKAVDAKVNGMRSGRKFAQPPSAGGVQGWGGRQPVTEKGESMINLLYRKAQGDPEARTSLIEMSQKAAAEYGEKALSEATGSSGYLVPPQYWQQGIAEYRIAAARVRQLCRVINGITSNLVYIPRETGIATVGWTAENAPKPSTDQTFGQLAVNIFTLAGISKISNQLLEDSTPAVDQIVRADLGRLLGQAEDIAFLVGTGAGQPTGILNTAGILSGALGAATIADAIASAIAAIQANYFGDPEAIVINPKHLNVMRTAKDSNNRYIFEPAFFMGNSPVNRAFMENSGNLGGGFTGFPSQGGPQGTVWGLPLYADANLPAPTNLGNIIVGAFSEAYVLERTGVTIDVSSEAGTSFEQNQTWFRGEERLGFTAARQPTAFYAITTIP
jgi:HK97 family phage major capsid protein/HK97 family phage prohead protease